MTAATNYIAPPDWVEGVDTRLEVLSSTPLVLSTPAALLAEQRITDTRHLFIRNIEDVPERMTLAPVALDGWQIELSGLITPARVVVRAEELAAMEQIEYEMILQCSGNGRNAYGGTEGTPWDQGGVGNVRFRGVALKTLLDRYHVAIDPAVKYLTAGGHDGSDGDHPRVEHSLPIADVLERSILALHLNGERLPAIHGGPVRLVTPGLFGTMQIKWLSRLRFETVETGCFYHAIEYRIPNVPLNPGDAFQFTLQNSRPTWDIRLVSYILEPSAGAALKAGPTRIGGVAFNDGKARIDSVLLSWDKGRTWRAAAFDLPDSPYSWYRWTIEATLAAGTHEIWARATDTLGRSQPLDGRIFWNPNGYEWTGVCKHAVVVE